MSESAHPEPAVWDFFIAHASVDRNQAEELYRVLSQNARVFVDSCCLLPGDDWQTELKRAQRRSRITVVLVSSCSESAYYECEEIASAIAMSREAGTRHRVVPVFLDAVPDEAIPYGLRGKQALFLNSGGLAAIAASLTEVLTRIADRPVGASTNPDAAEQRRVRESCSRLSYQKLAKSRLALRELAAAARQGTAPVRESLVEQLKEFLLDMDELRWEVIPSTVRDLRKSVLNVLRLGATGTLGRYFQEGEFEDLDLYGMDFSSEKLIEVSFSRCFLVEADFSASDLERANFISAHIRNVNFTGANLSNVDFSDADWFNAFGLSEDQISRVRPGTLLECPPNIEGMQRELSDRYGLPFSAWSRRVQQQLVDTWKDYLRPGGLRDIMRS